MFIQNTAGGITTWKDEKARTFQERRGEVDTKVSIPASLPLLLHQPWNLIRVKFFKRLQDAVLTAKSHDDLRHPEQEGLNPELEQLALVFKDVAVRKRSCGSLELNPIDGIVSA